VAFKQIMEEVLCILLLNKNLFSMGLATKKELAITYYTKKQLSPNYSKKPRGR
jgi:hypothetical protein